MRSLYWIIVNARAGNGRARKVWKEFQAVLERDKAEYRVLSASSTEEVCAAFREKISQGERPRAVIVIGGDGTVHGVLEVVLEAQIPLGVIPAGSGNDLVRSLQLPWDVQGAWDLIREGRCGMIDVLSVGGIPSISIAGAGLDAEVAYQNNRSMLKKVLNRLGLGQAAYIWSLLRVLCTFRAESVIMTLDGRAFPLHKVWLVAMANLPYYGGGMYICPEARANDSQINVCIVSGVSRLGLLRAFPKVYRGAHLDHPAITMYQGREVGIRQASSADESLDRKPLRLHGDGELIGTAPIQVTIDQRKLHILVSERGISHCISLASI